MKQIAIKIIFFIILIAFQQPLFSQVRILTIGDSTMADYDEEKNSGEKEKRGWAQMLTLFIKDGTELTNAARNGRSSKSFYYELWGDLKKTIHPGDYVFIQFGHNDEKGDGLDTDETDTGKNRGTAAWGQYQKYLKIYVEDVRERRGNPVLLTPVVRRLFDENNRMTGNALHNLNNIAGNDSIMNYPMAMRQLAKELSVPLVDMTALTQKLVEEMGAEEAKEIIYARNDNTHLKAMGGILFSKLAVEDLLRQNILTDYLVVKEDLMVKPLEIDFGLQFIKDFMDERIVKTLTLVGFGLSPESGYIQALEKDMNSPFFIGDGSFSSKFQQISYSQSFVNDQLYVDFVPKNALMYKSEITLILNGGKEIKVPVSGQGVSVKGAKKIISGWGSIDGVKRNDITLVDGKLTLNGLEHVKALSGYSLLPVSGNWPSGDIDMDASRYIEFSINTSDLLYISSVSFDVGGQGAKDFFYTALGSTDPSFMEYKTFTVMEPLANAVSQNQFPSVIKVLPGEAFYLRIYPWSKTSGDTKYFLLNSIFIEGYSFDK